MALGCVVPHLKALIFHNLESDGQGHGNTLRVSHALLKNAILLSEMANQWFWLHLTVGTLINFIFFSPNMLIKCHIFSNFHGFSSNEVFHNTYAFIIHSRVSQTEWKRGDELPNFAFCADVVRSTKK